MHASSFVHIFVLCFTFTVHAYRVTFPSLDALWTSEGPNLLSWVRVATDPTQFATVLVNQVRSSHSSCLNASSAGIRTGLCFQSTSSPLLHWLMERLDLSRSLQHRVDHSLLAQAFKSIWSKTPVIQTQFSRSPLFSPSSLGLEWFLSQRCRLR